MFHPFHLAFQVHDLGAARQFYGELLGCAEGRSADRWVDFNLYGHQIVAHLDEDRVAVETITPVDGDDVPVPHFGVILSVSHWRALAERLQKADIQFQVEPRIRFQGETGEQMTMFIRDPSGNALEFKAFGDPEQIFAT